MSVKLSAYVWDGCAAAGIKGNKLLIMLRLADFASDEGVAYPSVATIARQLGAGRSTVISLIGDLEKGGWLQKKERRQGQRSTSNLYVLNVAKLRRAASDAYFESPISGRPETERPETEHPETERPECSEIPVSQGPKTGHDPSVNSKQDPSDKNTTGQPPAADARGDGISDEITITDNAILVLRHLNMLTGAKYTTAKSTLQNIRARLVDGYSVDELKLTVEYLVDRWLGTEWAKYLNPETIFRPAKFPGNMLAANAWTAAGRKSSPAPGTTDHADRDAAFVRLVAQRSKPNGRVEQVAKVAAGKAGLGRMNEITARAAWKSIWAQAVEQATSEGAK